MPALENTGKLAAVTIVFYLPILVTTVILVFRHGFRRDSGWIFLLIFSNIRILGAALLIAAQLVRPVDTGLFTVAYILESVGLSPLLLATLGFLRTVGQSSFSEDGRVTRSYQVLGVLATVALILSIIGGTSTDESNLRHIGVILFVVLYVLLVAIHTVYWLNARTLMKHRKTLLFAISFALPFLGIRLLYAVLSAFSGPLSSTSTPNTGSLAKFNTINGDWKIYLGMSLLMEYIAVIIYTTAGIKIPLRDDTAPEQHTMYAAPLQTAYFPKAQTQYNV